MTGTEEERAYRWQRRCIFAITLAITIALPLLCVLLA